MRRRYYLVLVNGLFERGALPQSCAPALLQPTSSSSYSCVRFLRRRQIQAAENNIGDHNGLTELYATAACLWRQGEQATSVLRPHENRRGRSQQPSADDGQLDTEVSVQVRWQRRLRLRGLEPGAARARGNRDGGGHWSSSAHRVWQWRPMELAVAYAQPAQACCERLGPPKR